MLPTNGLVGVLFELLNSIAVRMRGTNINRKTVDNKKKAGWYIQAEKNLSPDIVWLIEAGPQMTT
jgi:hypothetical protein